jgi:hypothetical protein
MEIVVETRGFGGFIWEKRFNRTEMKMKDKFEVSGFVWWHARRRCYYQPHEAQATSKRYLSLFLPRRFCHNAVRL